VSYRSLAAQRALLQKLRVSYCVMAPTFLTYSNFPFQ
jgi:hypothetical protein